MKKNILFLFLLFSSISFSQNIRFEGTVKDTTGVGLEMDSSLLWFVGL